MKFKPAFKYQVYDIRRPVIIFYIVVVILFSLILISTTLTQRYDIKVTVSGLEAATIIFLFVVGLNSYKSTFRMMMVNGVSRKTMFISFIAMAAAVSMGMALIDSLLGFILKQFINYRTVFEMQHNYSINGIVPFVTGLAWQLLSYLCAMFIGYLITTLYYRMNKAVKLLVSIGVPVFFLILFPIIDSILFGGAVYREIVRIFGYISGLRSQSPLISICFNLMFSVLWAGLSYIALRRAPVKD